VPDFPRVALTYSDVVSGCQEALTNQGYTTTRASRIDRLSHIEAHRDPVEGTASFLTTDTYPKTVTIIDTSGLADVAGKQHLVEGFVDLSALASGESVKIRESMIIKSGGDFKTYAEETYNGPVSPPLCYILTRPGRYGLKIELVMESAPAADRSLDYQLLVKVVE